MCCFFAMLFPIFFSLCVLSMLCYVLLMNVSYGVVRCFITFFYRVFLCFFRCLFLCVVPMCLPTFDIYNHNIWKHIWQIIGKIIGKILFFFLCFLICCFTMCFSIVFLYIVFLCVFLCFFPMHVHICTNTLNARMNNHRKNILCCVPIVCHVYNFLCILLWLSLCYYRCFSYG